MMAHTNSICNSAGISSKTNAGDELEVLSTTTSGQRMPNASVHVISGRTAQQRTKQRDQIAAFRRKRFVHGEKIISASKKLFGDGDADEAEEEINDTVFDQQKVEKACADLFRRDQIDAQLLHSPVTLRKNAHRRWLLDGLTGTLSTDWESMDASQPWLLFWMTHAISLLGSDDQPLMPDDVVNGCVDLLKACQDKVAGGFGGGPKQFPHLAPTYAAVNCLATLRCETAYEVVDRKKLYTFIESLKQADGSFCVHTAGGENDLRAAYCAVSVCTLLNIPNREKLFDSVVINWIGSCQTYQGGFGEVPGAEAHGGYTYCAVSALFMLNALSAIDVHQCLRWCTQQQKPFEGGFCGRSNKLVDSCYSLWTAGAIPLLQNEILRQQSSAEKSSFFPKPDHWLFDTGALQEYVMICCQAAGSVDAGGLRDKPGKPVDYYHAAYSLAGTSLAQHQPSGERDVLGDAENLLAPIHPAYNITVEAYADIHRYFYAESITKSDDTLNRSSA